jgi:hypothetical protein
MPAEDLTETLAELVVLGLQDPGAALPRIRQLFDDNPELWRRYGDVARRAELELADLIAGGDVALKEAVLRHAEEQKAELTGPGASPLEKVLASNIAASWLEDCHARLASARARAAPLAQADFYQRRQDQAQRRLIAGLKMLALIRKLIRPAPAPVEIASRLGGAAPRASARHDTRAGRGVAVVN